MAKRISVLVALDGADEGGAQKAQPVGLRAPAQCDRIDRIGDTGEDDEQVAQVDLKLQYPAQVAMRGDGGDANNGEQDAE